MTATTPHAFISLCGENDLRAVLLARKARIRELEDHITELAAHIDAATFQWLELVREYDECNGWAGPGLLSCAHWLSWKCGLALGAARERVRVAHALKDLPRISAAFREGRVSYSKARAMTRVATAKNEDALLNIALHGTATHVERVVRNYRKVKRIEALEQENTRHSHRELNWYIDDGSFVLQGRSRPSRAPSSARRWRPTSRTSSKNKRTFPRERPTFPSRVPSNPARNLSQSAVPTRWRALQKAGWPGPQAAAPAASDSSCTSTPTSKPLSQMAAALKHKSTKPAPFPPKPRAATAATPASCTGWKTMRAKR